MEVAFLKDWLAVGGGVLGVGGAVYAWLTASGNKALKKASDVEAGVNALEKRVAVLELEMEHLPSKDDIAELKLSLADLKGSVNVFGESLAGVQRTVSRIDGYLRKDPA